MTLIQFQYFCFVLVQQVPPPPNPNGTQKMTTPVGDTVPLDSSLWVLLVIAMIIAAYAILPRLKKAV